MFVLHERDVPRSIDVSNITTAEQLYALVDDAVPSLYVLGDTSWTLFRGKYCSDARAWVGDPLSAISRDCSVLRDSRSCLTLKMVVVGWLPI